MADNSEKRVCLGRIKGPHGLQGELRVQTFTELPENIAAYGALSDASGGRQFEITRLRIAKKDVIIRLKDVNDRAAAEALRGVKLCVTRAQLGEPEDEESWFYADLIGLVAVDDKGDAFAHVKSVQDFGAGDLLELLITATGKTEFIPFTREAVPQIDLNAGQLTVVLPRELPEEQPEDQSGDELADQSTASEQR